MWRQSTPLDVTREQTAGWPWPGWRRRRGPASPLAVRCESGAQATVTLMDSAGLDAVGCGSRRSCAEAATKELLLQFRP
jgi:hypothetical protein